MMLMMKGDSSLTLGMTGYYLVERELSELAWPAHSIPPPTTKDVIPNEAERNEESPFTLQDDYKQNRFNKFDF
jgi:hypothetical protein